MQHSLPLSLPFHLRFRSTKRSLPLLLILSLLLLLLGPAASAQPAAGVGSSTDCPASPPTITGAGCVGSPLAVSTDYPAASIVWQQGNTVVKTALSTYGNYVRTVAGGNATGSNANQFNEVQDITLDRSGNLYVADVLNHRIQQWAPGATAGVTVAGGNGPGSGANQLTRPLGVAVDESGNLYVADSDNHRIQQWAPGATAGVTVAGGNGAGGNSNQLNLPVSVTVDESGNLYVADYGNHRIQKWAPGATQGVTAAGGNGAGHNLNQLSSPQDITLDPSGNLYVADMANHRVQKWAPGATAGVRVAGGNASGWRADDLYFPRSVTVDGNGNLYVSDHYNHRIQQWAPGATAGVTVAGAVDNGDGELILPMGVAIDKHGNLYVADNDIRIKQFSPTIDATYTPAGAGNYTATVSTFNGCTAGAAPVAVTEGLPATLGGGGCVGSPLTLRIAYPAAGIVWRKGTAVVKTTFATYPANGVSAAGGNGEGSSAAQLNRPYGVAADGSGNVYVADVLNHRIQKWAPGATAGVTVAGGHGPGSRADQLFLPYGVAVDHSGNLYVADVGNHRIQRWTPGATQGFTVAGGKGAGSAAGQLNQPFGVAVDESSNVYVADMNNHRIQKWAPGATAGVTVAGGNGAGNGAGQLSRPQGLAVDGSGNLYVADYNNHRIQQWTPGTTAGVTVAGGNGAGSSANQLYHPAGVTLDVTGNLYVADAENHRIQQWAPGTTTGVTVAGGKGDGGNADQFNYPFGLATDGSGNLYVADMNNHRIQKWAPNARAGVTAAGGNGTGNGAGQLSRPQGVAVDGSGNLYVADYNNHRIQQWTPGALAGVTVAGGNGAGVNANQLNHPSGVILDMTGNVYVADAENHRIQQWAPGAMAGVTVAGSKGDGGNADQFNYPFGLATDGRGNLYVADMLNHRVQQFSPTLDAAYTPAEAGAYSATVTTFSGCAAEAAPIAVTEAIVITAQPEGAAKCAGESVSMSVAATGADTSYQLSYQWQRNGMNIEGATGATFEIAFLKPGDAGNYRVMVKSDCGTIASAVAALTVTTPAATLSSSAAGNRINAGQAITFTAAPASAAHYQFFVGATPVQSGAADTYTTSALSDGAVVTVKVTTAGGCTATSAGLAVAVNAIPVAGHDAYEVDENQTLTLAAPGVLGNDTDADGDALTAALVPGSAIAHGSLTFNADGSFTYAPVPYYHGPDAFTYAVRDGRGGSTTATVQLTVRPVNDAPVVAAPLAAQTVQYSDPVRAVAITATDADNDPLAATASWRKAGETTFTAGLPAGLTLSAAAPNAWTMAGKMTLSPGVYIVRVTVGDGTSSDNSYGFADVKITVTGEDAVTTYTGTTFAFTAGTRATTAGVLLSATVQDVSATSPADASPGDIRKAAVTFRIVRVTSSGETFIKEVPAPSLTYVNASDTRTAIATANWTADIGAADAAMFKAYVLVGGSYGENPVNMEAITVSKPLADFVVGGGSVLPSAPAGLLAGTGVVMGKTSFGVSIKYAKNGSSPKGFVNLFIRRKVNGVAQVLQVKSNAFSSFGVQRSTPARSTVVTKASVQEIGPAGTIDWGGNYTVSLSLVDNGNPGTKDLIGITIYDKDNQLWYAASWNGVKTLEQNLISGGLSINSSSSFATTPSARVSAAEEASAAGVSLVSYPNPFSEATTVAFSLPESGDYALEVYDAKGVRVAHLKEGQALAGEVNRVEWQAGKTLSGVYLLRLTTRAGVQHLKLLLR